MGQQSILPFQKGFYWVDAPTGANGVEYTDADGNRYKTAVVATGGTVNGQRVLKWTDRSALTVEYTTASTDIPCGISPKELVTDGTTVPSGATFLMQVDGRAEVYCGSGASTTAGQLVKPHNDADKGKAMGAGAAVVTGTAMPYILGRAVDTIATADIAITVDLFHNNLKG